MEDDAPPGVPAWVVTYGDMMSLLLTFFIMLVSMSELKDEGKNRAALNSMKEIFGPMEGTSGVAGRTFNDRSTLEHMSSKSEKIKTGIEKGNINSAGSGGQESQLRQSIMARLSPLEAHLNSISSRPNWLVIQSQI